MPTGREVANFICACEAIHALLAVRLLEPADRDVIEFTCRELLVKLTLRPS